MGGGEEVSEHIHLTGNLELFEPKHNYLLKENVDPHWTIPCIQFLLWKIKWDLLCHLHYFRQHFFEQNWPNNLGSGALPCVISPHGLLKTHLLLAPYNFQILSTSSLSFTSNETGSYHIYSLWGQYINTSESSPSVSKQLYLYWWPHISCILPNAKKY